MGPVKALFDSNILIDYLNGIVAARDEIGRYQRPSISLITWMEVLVGAAPDETAPVRTFLRRFECIGIDSAVAECAVELRQAKHLKLPDAIIRATAMQHSALLVTRNTKDFPDDEPGIRVPYSL
ncbi:MAG: type II toxin-antitoxin system VapC family toxin [Thiohalocapsa sp.]